MATHFWRILTSLQDQLSSVLDDEQCVYVIARNLGKTIPNLTADKDILLRPRGFTVSQSVTEAAGRYYMKITRNIEIIPRLRMGLDLPGSDLQWLTKEAEGFLQFEEAILSAVQMWQPVGASDETDPITGAAIYPGLGMPLLVEPARVLSGSDSNREIASADGQFGAESIILEVVYEQVLEQLQDGTTLYD